LQKLKSLVMSLRMNWLKINCQSLLSRESVRQERICSQSVSQSVS
jgi:hypothetical protein